MRSFVSYISEQTTYNRDVCRLLSGKKDSDEMKRFRDTPPYDFDAPMRRLVFELDRWSVGWKKGIETSVSRSDVENSIIDSVFKCKTRADWSMVRKGVSVYRGLIRTADEIRSMGIVLDPRITWSSLDDGTISGQGFEEWIIGRSKYRSKHILQSWTIKPGLARVFASGTHTGMPTLGNYRVILRHIPKNPKNTLVLDSVNEMLSNSGEGEVILNGNEEMAVEVAMNIPSMLYTMGALGKANTSASPIPILADKVDALLGKKNADVLFASKAFNEFVKRTWKGVEIRRGS